MSLKENKKRNMKLGYASRDINDVIDKGDRATPAQALEMWKLLKGKINVCKLLGEYSVDVSNTIYDLKKFGETRCWLTGSVVSDCASEKECSEAECLYTLEIIKNKGYFNKKRMKSSVWNSICYYDLSSSTPIFEYTYDMFDDIIKRHGKKGKLWYYFG